MAMTPTESAPNPQDACNPPSIETILLAIELRLAASTEHTADRADFEALTDDLRRLHLQLRVHHTEGFRRGTADASSDAPPELAETYKRLISERPRILGDLDRLIRTSEFVADATIEDRDVFTLRVKELFAMLRRHQAEEERLFFKSVWQDTGGES